MNDLQAVKTRSIKVSFLSQAIVTIITLLKTPILLFFISPNDFGILAIAVSITGIIQLFKDFGYSTYIVKEQEINY